ncbi:hypothetical protein EQG49_12670 [Periweissella cryptocerci]|uniref:Uncharacterized protein n=1 Tax=Periweissella cryptocerci TaxID=2506420 RepID=A0A4P6YWR8_9LACO|nr:hypothetical protein [Periweissella cryptocerci]QBO37251.1 hypothetical protein EQG49_12670 [Periweissella cryptocerci]
MIIQDSYTKTLTNMSLNGLVELSNLKYELIESQAGHINLLQTNFESKKKFVMEPRVTPDYQSTTTLLELIDMQDQVIAQQAAHIVILQCQRYPERVK